MHTSLFMIFLHVIVLHLFLFCRNYEILSLKNDFLENEKLGRDLTVLVIVKDFTLMQRTFEKHKAHKDRVSSTLHISGRQYARYLGKGVIFNTILNEDEIVYDKANWKFFPISPSGIDFFGNKLIVSGGSALEEIDIEKGTSTYLPDDWFRHLHTVFYNYDGTKCLVTSSGFDLIMEYDLINRKTIWDWSPWEHGFNISQQGNILTRCPELAKELASEGKPTILADPNNEDFGLNGIPTGLRSCHVNGAFYDSNETIGVTFGHRNLAVIINKTSDEFKIVNNDTFFPHSFNHQDRDHPCRGYILADTKKGGVVFMDDDFNVCLKVSTHDTFEYEDFSSKTFGFEWTQFVNHLQEDLYSIIDSKRKLMYLVDMVKREYRAIAYPVDLSIQEVRLEPKEHSTRLKEYFDRRLFGDEENTSCRDHRKKRQKRSSRIRLTGKKRQKELERIKDFTRILISEREIEELGNIAAGKYLPLEGFMTERQFDCVLERNTLCDSSKFWEKDSERKTVVLSISKYVSKSLEVGEEIVLVQGEKTNKHFEFILPDELEERKEKQKREGPVVAVMKVEDIYEHDRFRHSFLLHRKSIVGEDQCDHEGMNAIFRDMKDILVGGKVVSYLF